jgi:hypothetical protein
MLTSEAKPQKVNYSLPGKPKAYRTEDRQAAHVILGMIVATFFLETNSGTGENR